MFNYIKNAFFLPHESHPKGRLLLALKKNIIVNFLGSFCYIALKLFFNFFIIYKTNATFYGGMGYLFSYIFLLVNLASAPTLYTPSNIISPETTRSQAAKMFLILFSLQAFLLFCASYFLWDVLHQNQRLSPLFSSPHEQQTLFAITALLVFMEGIRLSLRFLMHMINKTKLIVPFEIGSMIFYMAVVFYFVYFAQEFSLIHIFGPFLFDSLLVTSFFILLLIQWYQQLSDKVETIKHSAHSFFKHFCFLPSTAHALSFYVDALLSDNMIIVSFMPSLGLSAIALPKISAYVADSLRILTKSLIGFSALPLFSMAKTEDHVIKKELYLKTKNYFFLLLSFSFCAVLLGVVITKETNPSAFAYQSIFFVSLFFAIKLANQINYFYEKIMIFNERSFLVIIVSTVKMAIAATLLFVHPPLSTILYSLLFIKSLSGLFYHFYVQRTLHLG
jgi:hypothetical protein